MTTATSAAQREVPASSLWDDPDTARRYASFTASSDWYATLAADLAARAALSDARLVLDLCAGTGISTIAILEQMPAQSRLIAVDRSAAMLHHARGAVTDPRVQWAQHSAETCAALAAAGTVDAIVCSAGLWDTRVPTVLDQVARLLRPHGRFVFNLSPAALGAAVAPRAGVPGLWERILHHAQLRFQYVPASTPPTDAASSSALLTPRWPTYAAALAACDITIGAVETLEYAMPSRDVAQWLAIPIFRPVLPPLTTDQVRAVVDLALRDLGDRHTLRVPWTVVTAIRTPADQRSSTHELSKTESTFQDG